MAEVPFRPARQLSEYKGKGASASREAFSASLPKKTGQDLRLRFQEGMTKNKSKLCEPVTKIKMTFQREKRVTRCACFYFIQNQLLFNEKVLGFEKIN